MSFHLYTINELYSNADGSNQFIEMTVGGADGEGFWAGRSISVSQGSTTHSFTFPSDLPSESTANTKVLIATQGFANLGIVSPDFIIPSGFLFTNGGTVNYAGVDSFSYTALPTDAATSLGRSGNTAPATPTDFAGVTGKLAAAGGGGSSSLLGGAGNDTLHGTSGNDTLDGGAGIDTVVYSGVRSHYTVTKTATGYTVTDTTGVDGSDTLINVERLQFADAKVAIDTSGDGGEAYRLYQAAFNRVPDLGGLGFQMKALDDGWPLATVAQNFIDSPEFSATYGSLNTTAFVQQMYLNVLHRTGDPVNEIPWYATRIDSGVMSRAAVLVGFSESPENQAAVIGVIQNGMTYTV